MCGPSASARGGCVTLDVLGDPMSAEDVILYRKIGDKWYVLGYAFTFDAELTDEEFRIRSRFICKDFDAASIVLKWLDCMHHTEHGICYAGEYKNDPPAVVPAEHRALCCLPESERET